MYKNYRDYIHNALLIFQEAAIFMGYNMLFDKYIFCLI